MTAGVVFLDSSVLFNLLDVPDKSGDRQSVVAEFQRLTHSGSTFVFPITAPITLWTLDTMLSSHA